MMETISLQDVLAGTIVLFAFGFLFRRLYKKYFAASLAKLFLKMGKVKWAQKIRRQSKPGCDDCR